LAVKAEHRMSCNFLARRLGDSINAVFAAAGYNFRRLRLLFLSLCAPWLYRTRAPEIPLPHSPECFTVDFVISTFRPAR
jgi:hypothetical protein